MAMCFLLYRGREELYCAELLTVNNPEGLARTVEVTVMLAVNTLFHPLPL